MQITAGFTAISASSIVNGRLILSECNHIYEDDGVAGGHTVRGDNDQYPDKPFRHGSAANNASHRLQSN